MIPNPLQTLFRSSIFSPKNINFFRYLRSIAPRGVGPKLIVGKVKTVTQYDDPNATPEFETYKDFIKSIRMSKLGDELEVEKQFLSNDYHGDVTERCEMYYDMHEREEKSLKSRIKKKIVGRKYFKLDKETNLLTHAAKEQIQFLHNSDPLEWNCKTLSECFPISEAGVKKLLKSNFIQTCPEKMKLHDKEVAKRWKILKSGKSTNEISPLTQRLYQEGKLVDDYFSGNPNLPTVPPSNKKTIEIKKQEIGEFSAIVKTYTDYQNQKLLESGKEDSSEKQVSIRDPVIGKRNNLKNVRQFKYINDEDDDADPQVYPTRVRKGKDFGDIPFSQFKEILKEETSAKLESKYKNEYDDFVMQEMSKKHNPSPKEPQDIQKCFLKIPKYNNENVDAIYEKNKSNRIVYKYNEKLGYQYPVGKNIKGKINVSAKQYNNKKLHKVGSCIYDDDGEFLYRVP